MTSICLVQSMQAILVAYLVYKFLEFKRVMMTSIDADLESLMKELHRLEDRVKVLEGIKKTNDDDYDNWNNMLGPTNT